MSPPALSCSILLYPPVLLVIAANEHESILRDCLFSVIEKSDGSFAALAASSYTPVLAIVRMQQLQHNALQSAAHTCSKPDCHNLPDISWLYSTI